MTQISEQFRSLRVLVVDDYRPIADMLVGILQQRGCDTRAAYRGTEALCVAEEFRPHVVVLDMLLPDMDGFDLAEEFGRRFPLCRLLLTSAWDYEGEPAAARGSFKIVSKAALMDELLPFLDLHSRSSEEVEAVEGGG